MTNRIRKTMRLLLLLAAASPWQSMLAQDAQPTEIPQPGLRTISVAEYTSQLAGLHDLVGACRDSVQACDAAKVGSDDEVKEAGFHVHWQWLRELLVEAKDPKLEHRDALLQAASNRLEEQAREAGMQVAQPVAGARGAVPFAQARASADKVLAGAEFRTVTKNPYWEQFLAKVGDWLDRMFGGVSSLGEHHRWLGPLLEWGFLTLALASALVWAGRVMQRQRLAIRFDGPTGTATWQETSRNWTVLAQAAADKGKWREAVHSLYWASVTELEGRRIWRQNSARTPREYLRLLQTNAPQFGPLRQLTLALERFWYGLGQAEQSDYDRALALYEELRAT